MSTPELTPEQEAAAGAGGREVLVEAGAGTGKTGVMVERYCRLVCGAKAAPDSVLAFTFTDKAAAELRERIRASLEVRAAAGSSRARELVGNFGGAWVTTIHGFCNRLLAGHPVAAGVDPRFRVLDAPETERIAAEAFDEALEEFLAGGDPDRERTVATFDLGEMRAIVLRTYAELRSRGLARPRLPEPPAVDPSAALRKAAEVAAETLLELKPTNSTRELVERAVSVLGGAPDQPPDLEALVGLRTGSRAQAMLPYREAIEAAVSRCAEAGEGGQAYRHVAELLGLFSGRFEAAKARRSGIDFEDLQLLAVNLLERAEIGDAYRSRFSHILVDEFQDTNRLQLRLIDALRGPRTALMMVGDELQSIYGFRHADIDVFRAQRAALEAKPEAEALRLSGNFRARPALIGAVNEIGAKLFGDSFRELRVGAAPSGEEAACEEAAVEILLTARDGWDGEGIELEPATDSGTPLNNLAEARFLAARLAEIVEAGVPRGEIVVLLRAFTHLDAYEDSLQRAGLRPYTIGGQGYWSHQQVGDVCALLATIANPLDDQALFGALASPACGATPDTLWLLRTAAGRGRHIWPALERAAGVGEAELDAAERLEQIPPQELELLRLFAGRIAELRRRGPRLPLADLLDAAVTATGYDLAILGRPEGEARFANVRKLMRLAAEFEAREGRDLRGLLDFLAARADADADAGAATSVEGHDGVRIMTIHSAKGLEFEVVAVPQLARRLLAGSRLPVLSLGRGEGEPEVGMQLRRLGAASINIFAHDRLCEESQRRDAEEELRLFHVAATRARRRLILSGVVAPRQATEIKPGTAVIERIVGGFEIDREADSTLAVSPPPAREGLDADFASSEIAVRVSLPSPQRAAELTAIRRDRRDEEAEGGGPAPLIERRPPVVPSRPLSYTAIAAYGECAYRFYMERVLGLGERARHLPGEAGETANAAGGREERAARGAAVHALLEWSQANEWREPAPELARRHAVAAGLDPELAAAPEDLLGPIRAWLESPFFARRVAPQGAAARAEVPLLLGIDGAVLRGSIDLLVERPGSPPLVVDYKTDRLRGSTPAQRAGGYEIQRSIYALAVAESLDAPQVEVAYVFLEAPGDPVVTTLDGDQMARDRARIAAEIERISAGDFPPAAPVDRSWELCRGCPALGRLCSGPEREPDA